MGNTWLSFLFDVYQRIKMNTINKWLGKKFDISVMYFKRIHMTSVFMGKFLRGKQVSDLKKVNEIIAEENENLKEMNITLEFDRYEYLPLNCKPEKRKLLIALYKNNKKFNDWNVNLRKRLMEYDVCKYNSDLMAHITIGRVYGSNLPKDFSKIRKYPNIEIRGMYLCGEGNKHIKCFNHFEQ